MCRPASSLRLIQSAQEADYCNIFNRFGVKTSKRAAAKADGLGQVVLQEVLSFLKTCLIAGPQHVLEMARGASFLRSLTGVEKQDDHTDFDFRDFLPPLAFRRAKPFSIWIALAHALDHATARACIHMPLAQAHRLARNLT